jgi:hypothetical protein
MGMKPLSPKLLSAAMEQRLWNVLFAPRLWSHAASWWSLAAVLFAVAVIVRIALYFSLSFFQIDSDGVLAGLCAFHIGDGHYPAFFPGGTRLSAASCYVAAGFFHLFGAGRVGLALTGLTWATLYLLFTLLFLKAMLGLPRACAAFLFAIVPPEQFVTVTYVPWGYGEIMASCAATLWLAALWRARGALWQRLAFGASVGFGLWISLQTLMIALPAIAWILLRRRATIAECIPALLAMLAGAIPFWLGNVAAGFPSLSQNWASRPASSTAQVWENFGWLISSPLPKLLFHGYSGWESVSTIFILAYAVVAVGFTAALIASATDPNSGIGPREAGQLLLLVATSCVLLFVFSQAGSMRGWTVRYIAPLYVVVPLFCGIGVSALWRRSRLLAVGTAAALLVPNLFLYSLPGSQARAQLAADLQNDVRLRELLAHRHVRFVYGDYFWVYHLNFDSRERIAGVPSYAAADYFDYGNAMAATPARWAMLGGLQELLGWARGVGARGTMTTDGDLWVFIADRPSANPGSLLVQLRRTFH